MPGLMNTELPDRPRGAPAYQDIFEQYVDEASFLWILRSISVKQPHYLPKDVLELEMRIDANLDGLMTSLETGWQACTDAMSIEEPGEIFTASVVAFRSRDPVKIQAVVTTGLADQRMAKGLISALGWLPGQIVYPWIQKFLTSKDLDHKYLALAACSIRRENPETHLAKILQREDCRANSRLHARALRLAGELKRNDLLSDIENAMQSDDEQVKFWANWSATLLGNKAAVNRLQDFIQHDDPALGVPALNVVFRVLPLELARSWISRLAEDPKNARTVVKATGILGDPHAVPWLIGKMRDAKMARLAGESFSMLTGIDLERHELAVDIPEDISVIPNDDPEDDDVGLDEDENLPWPDSEKVGFLWQKYGRHFMPGQRYFQGKPVEAGALLDKLRNGYQRQRQAAAYELALLEPDRMLANTAARVGVLQ